VQVKVAQGAVTIELNLLLRRFIGRGAAFWNRNADSRTLLVNILWIMETLLRDSFDAFLSRTSTTK
jgi:hypothetical protein